MRLLVDNALSPRVAAALAGDGHDVVHVRDRGLHAASDVELLELAREEGRVIVSADSDFGTLLALRDAQRPSFLLWRSRDRPSLEKQARAIASVIDQCRDDLDAGAVVVIDDERIRVRRLPIGG